MLRKLLKYDLKYMLKLISIFYLLSLFFAITTRMLFSLETTVIINIISQISVGCLFAMLVNTLINTIMRSWVRFKDFTYGQESYLTHTLPVTKRNIYESRFILTLIYLLSGFLIIVISLFITYYTKERWLMLSEFINNISTNINITTTAFVIFLLIILFLEILNVIQSGYLGIILGHKKNNNKIGFSVLFGFITYIISQISVLIIFFIAGIFNKNIMQIFISNTIGSNTIKTIIILAILAYSFVIFIINMLCVKSLNKGVNIE